MKPNLRSRSRPSRRATKKEKRLRLLVILLVGLNLLLLVLLAWLVPGWIKLALEAVDLCWHARREVAEFVFTLLKWLAERRH